MNCMDIRIQADFGLCEIVGVSRVCINYNNILFTITHLKRYIHPCIDIRGCEQLIFYSAALNPRNESA